VGAVVTHDAEAGGAPSQATHLYSYPDLEVRDALRSAAASNKEWVSFIDDSRKWLQQQVT